MPGREPVGRFFNKQARYETTLTAIVHCVRPWYSGIDHSAMSVEDQVIERRRCNALSGSNVMATAFDEEVIQLLAKIEEVDIETRAGPDAPSHRVTIWVVVDGDAAYVRSVRGARGRWYREATAYPEAVLHAGVRKLPVHLEPVS